MDTSKGKEMMTMKKYVYEVSVCYEKAELLYRTNDIYEALRFVRDNWNKGHNKVDFVDGYTGEVLLHSNGVEPLYMTPAMHLMWMGFTVMEEGE